MRGEEGRLWSEREPESVCFWSRFVYTSSLVVLAKCCRRFANKKRSITLRIIKQNMLYLLCTFLKQSSWPQS